jgi:hypothetical protein
MYQYIIHRHNIFIQIYLCSIDKKLRGHYTNKIFHYRHDDKEYNIKVSYLIGTDQDGEIIGDIYLLSPLEYNENNHCIQVIILRNNPHIDDMSDVTTRYTCADSGNPPRAGNVYTRIMLRFLMKKCNSIGHQRNRVGG